jgi:xylan 1,4-beta-xylosidase
LSTNGIDQPILNVFRMAGFFSGDRVAATSSAEVPAADIAKSGVRAQPDIDAFATKAAHEAAVMLWNYHDEDLPVPAAPVTVTITGIPADVHKVLVEHFRIDETHSNAFTVWKAMDSPQHPTPEQYSQLQSAGKLQLLSPPESLDVTSGTLTITTNLPREATSLLHLKW